MDDVIGKVDDLIGEKRGTPANQLFADQFQLLSEKKNTEERCALNGRAVLRIASNVLYIRVAVDGCILATLRAALVAVLRSRANHVNLMGIDQIAQSAHRFASQIQAAENLHAKGKAAEGALHAAVAAVGSTTASNTHFTILKQTARSAAMTAMTDSDPFDYTLHYWPQARAVFEVVSADAGDPKLTDHVTPLWRTIAVPDVIKENHDDFLKFMEADRGTWGFWHDWYLAMWEGRFTDWDLASEVAKIPDDVWERGAEAVAVEIAKRRAQLNAQRTDQPQREKAYEPKSVQQILANPEISAINFQSVAQNISVAFETFHRETGINQVPSSFMPLHEVPQLLVGMGRILQQRLVPADKEQALIEEVGRLNARIVELEAALEAALISSDPIVAPAFKEQLGKSLGDWKLYAALATSLWIVSGDDIGLQKRSEHLLKLRHALFGDVCPAPQIETDLGTMT